MKLKSIRSLNILLINWHNDLNWKFMGSKMKTDQMSLLTRRDGPNTLSWIKIRIETSHLGLSCIYINTTDIHNKNYKCSQCLKKGLGGRLGSD